MLIVAAGGEKHLISASQGCSEGETRPTVLAAACAQRYKNLLQHCTRAPPQRMVTSSPWVKHRNVVSEVKRRSCSLGEGWCFQKNKQNQMHSFFLPPPYLLIIWLLLSCKQYLKVFQPLSLKMSRKKGGDSLAGMLWSSCFTFWKKFRQPQDTHVIVISHPVCLVSQRLFTLGKKGESPATANLETWTHAFVFTQGFIPAFGFSDDIIIRTKCSA